MSQTRHCTVSRQGDRVTFAVRDNTGAVILQQEMSVGEFASLVCGGSVGNESDFRYYSAVKFLNSTGPVDIVRVPADKAGMKEHCYGEVQ